MLEEKDDRLLEKGAEMTSKEALNWLKQYNANDIKYCNNQGYGTEKQQRYEMYLNIEKECLEIIKKDLEVLEILKKHIKLEEIDGLFTDKKYDIKMTILYESDDYEKVKRWL